MWSWLKSLFNREPPEPGPEPEPLNVRQARITITENDGTVHTVYVKGRVWCDGDFNWVIDAETKFDDWREHAGKMGTVGTGNNHYVPLCNVKSIDVTYEDLFMKGGRCS